MAEPNDIEFTMKTERNNKCFAIFLLNKRHKQLSFIYLPINLINQL